MNEKELQVIIEPERLQEIKYNVYELNQAQFDKVEDVWDIVNELITALEAERAELIEARDKINDYEHEVEVLEEADFADRKYREEIREDFRRQLAEAQRENSNLHRKIKAMVTGEVVGE